MTMMSSLRGGPSEWGPRGTLARSRTTRGAVGRSGTCVPAGAECGSAASVGAVGPSRDRTPTGKEAALAPRPFPARIRSAVPPRARRASPSVAAKAESSTTARNASAVIERRAIICEQAGVEGTAHIRRPTRALGESFSAEAGGGDA